MYYENPLRAPFRRNETTESDMTTTTSVDRNPRVRVCTLIELQSTGMKLVSAEGRTVLIIADQGNVYALDNRCPHMGFPLQR